MTNRFLRMLAAVHGHSWNASQVGASLGLDPKTVNAYLDFLAGVFLIRKLSPYQTNIRKRLVKTPKVFWRDSGLLHSLLNVSSRNDLLKQPWVGASWEGFVIEQAIDTLAAAGRNVQTYYFRTSDQHEIELVLKMGKSLWAIEIKLTTSPSPADMDRLNHAADLIDADQRILVSQTKQVTRNDRIMSCDLDTFLERLTGSE